MSTTPDLKKGIPAAMVTHRDENGKFVKGHDGVPGAGRPLGSRLLSNIKGRHLEVPGELEYQFVAERLGIEVDQVPVFDELQKLLVWTTSMLALKGCDVHLKEMWDRMAPKPSRVQIDANMNVSRAPMGTVAITVTAADEYMRELEAAGEDED